MNNMDNDYYSMTKPYGFHDMHGGHRMDGFTSALPANPVVAMAYVPFQTDTTIYDDMRALKAGTLFPVLDKPFLAAERCYK
ncbi:MAG: spore coat associated protein CotJA [Clostridiales bacterium]|jgi:hypothetical protein|nr:spore coat associated protein CotJA [Clostridiales bacterium]